jgi:membrane protease subunit (stomatin/prohibitin family)
MAGAAGGANSAELLYKMEQQEASQPKLEEPQNGWTCACGSVNTGKFCSQCGSPKPVVESWTCACGSVNTGKFCPQCGNPKPQAVVCSNCGWKPEAGAVAGKFCPQCGTKL